jgi:hypothetical protein
MSSIISPTFTSLVVTHDNRIQQFLKIFRIRGFKPNNCAILKMMITIRGGSSHVSIEHIWNGSKQVYVSMYNSHIQMNTLTQLIPTQYLIRQCHYTFYIIRHGQGIHNLKGEMFNNLSRSDPYLTEEGEIQALAAGLFLQSLEIPNIDAYFVSTLQRTHQTLVRVLRGMFGQKQIINATILPRSEEISRFNLGSENDSDCFAVTDTGSFFRPEYNIYINQMERCNRIEYVDIILNIDWNFWNNNSISIFNDSNETMIFYAIQYLWENNSASKMLGGRLEMKKHRKSLKRKQYRKISKQRYLK